MSEKKNCSGKKIAGLSLLLALLLIAGAKNSAAEDITDAAGIFSFESGYSGLNALPAVDLEVGESKTVTVRANEPYNYADIYLRKDKKYKFTVSSPAWNNGLRETDAGGYNSSEPYANTRRHPNYKMMALVGEIFQANKNPSTYTGYKFLIGLGRDSYTAQRSGWLVTFANDCLPCYADNSRVVTLTVRRIS